jgi:hypothetical protein
MVDMFYDFKLLALPPMSTIERIYLSEIASIQ